LRTRNLELLALAAFPLGGCASLSMKQSAEPLPRGRWEVSGALDAVGYRDIPQDTRALAPQAEVAARRGLGSGLEAGVKMYLAGLEVGGKWRFYRRDRWAVAVAPAAAFSRLREGTLVPTSSHAFGLLTLLIGYDLGPRSSVNFGPRALYGLYVPQGGGSAQGVSAGAFVNLVFPLSERWTILPDFNLFRTVAGDVPVDGWSLQSGVAFGRSF
jgi:hypothetical protein